VGLVESPSLQIAARMRQLQDCVLLVKLLPGTRKCLILDTKYSA